jgi:hypothetical protein
MTQMIARRSFRYAGKMLKPGVTFAVSRQQDVKVLLLLGRAKEFIPEPPRVTQSASQPVGAIHESPVQAHWLTGRPADRLTGRLDDRQENPSEPEETTAPDQKPTRRYRRRDMKAEDV